MKKIVLLLSILLTACSSAIDFRNLTREEDGNMYALDEQMPYTGEAISYYPNGALKEKGTLLDGKMIGEYIEYYSDENIKIRGLYTNGLQNGEWTTYYENGIIALKGNFKNGILDGVWYTYYKNGKVAKKVLYKRGKIIRYIK